MQIVRVNMRLSILLLCQCALVLSAGTVDLVTIEGLTFTSNLTDHAGYLDFTDYSLRNGIDGDDTNLNFSIYYWIAEYQYIDDGSVPVIFWFDGGPGCSGLYHMFGGNGPYYVNRDGATLFENEYSWSKLGHLVTFDSPPGTGFSITSNYSFTWTDDTTAILHVEILHKLIDKHKWLMNRPVFITGESYAGIYMSMLINRLIDLNDTLILPNIKGYVLGDPSLHGPMNLAAAVPYLYSHGFMHEQAYQNIVTHCCDGAPMTRACGLQDQIVFNVTTQRWQLPMNECGKYIAEYIAVDRHFIKHEDVWLVNDICYASEETFLTKPTDHSCSRDSMQGCLNYMSTDQFNGFNCWKLGRTAKYLDDTGIRFYNARSNYRGFCADINYAKAYSSTMLPKIERILTKTNIKLMTYNGDADIPCNIIGQQWFANQVAEDLGLNITQRYTQWLYDGGPWQGGLWLSYDRYDFLTITGAGHSAQEYRPPQTFQVLASFIQNIDKKFINYSTPAIGNFMFRARNAGDLATLSTIGYLLSLSASLFSVIRR